ncbi:MAG TPA: hypothetical protein VNN08_00300 [Thermoanaerobaculia bacterium]|nr:hypothetical protein [Thermoanaerobaculia bacterium]
MIQRRVVFLAVFAVGITTLAHAQSTLASAQFFESVFATPPKQDVFRANGKTIGRARWWTIENRKSAYAGLTLLLIDVDASSIDLAIDGSKGFQELAAPSPQALVVLSGGTWAGDIDPTKVDRRVAAGLVVPTAGERSPLNNNWVKDRRGGVLLRCANGTLTIVAAELFAGSKPCSGGPYQALQSNTMLLRDGRGDNIKYDTGANRVAIGIASGRVFIAGAFDDTGLALPLRDFLQFIASAVTFAGAAKPTAINLEGACAAMVYLPRSGQRFGGCGRKQFLVNRLILSKRGA